MENELKNCTKINFPGKIMQNDMQPSSAGCVEQHYREF